MRKIYLALFCLFLVQLLRAQSEPPAYQDAVGEFQKLFNADNYPALYEKFFPEMKQALPEARAREFFGGLKKVSGNIITIDFVKFNNAAALYRAKFDRAELAVNFSLNNESKINGLLIKPFTETATPKITRNLTPMILPFADTWTVIWGGETKEQNYHVESPTQKHAFDVVVTDAGGRSYKTTGTANEDYYAFGKKIIAPCDALVVMAVDGVPDNTPGEMNKMFVTGNTVLLKTDQNEYLLFAHLKNHTVLVKEGDRVKTGQTLGLCGNSGHSSEPHLHFHIQDGDNLSAAAGVKAYFKYIIVNGKAVSDYSPVRGEKISNR